MTKSNNVDWLELIEELTVEVSRSPTPSNTPFTQPDSAPSTPTQHLAREIANHLSLDHLPEEAFALASPPHNIPYRKALLEASRHQCASRVLSQVARQLREDRLIDQHQFRNVSFTFLLVFILTLVWQFSFAQMMHTFQAIGPFRPLMVPWWMTMLEFLLAWNWLWLWPLALTVFFALRYWMQRVKCSTIRLQRIHEWRAVELVTELAKSWPLAQAVHVAQCVWGVEHLRHVESILNPANNPHSMELAQALIAKEAIQSRRMQTQFRRWWSEQLPRQIAVSAGAIAIVLYLFVAVFPLTMFLIDILQSKN